MRVVVVVAVDVAVCVRVSFLLAHKKILRVANDKGALKVHTGAF